MKTIKIINNTKKGYLEAHPYDGINLSSRMRKQRGNVQPQRMLTIDTMGGLSKGVVMEDLRIRKLTPKECWRLMGFSKIINGKFDDSAFEKAQLVNSDTQLYKQAGNSIVVDVLEAILRNLLLKG